MPKGKSEFEQKLSKARAQMETAGTKPRKITIRKSPGRQPPIQRIAKDAQLLNSQEIGAYRHLIQQ